MLDFVFWRSSHYKYILLYMSSRFEYFSANYKNKEGGSTMLCIVMLVLLKG